jgi:DNA-binding IclR family transcriptional regulator
MSDSPVKSALRVLTLLELLGNEGREMPHAALAASLDIPKSSLTQLLKTLTSQGWLTFSAESKSYSLGPKVGSLARRLEGAKELMAVAPDIIASLAAATGETSALNVRKGDEHEVVVTQLSPHRLLSVMHSGDRAPLYATSGGKAILAALPPAALDSYLARITFTDITPQTHRTVDGLSSDLAGIRAQGYAISNEEYTPGVVGIAQALLDAQGEVFASVSVAMPATRYSPDVQRKALDHIGRAVGSLSRTLG